MVQPRCYQGMCNVLRRTGRNGVSSNCPMYAVKLHEMVIKLLNGSSPLADDYYVARVDTDNYRANTQYDL